MPKNMTPLSYLRGLYRSHEREARGAKIQRNDPRWLASRGRIPNIAAGEGAAAEMLAEEGFDNRALRRPQRPLQSIKTIENRADVLIESLISRRHLQRCRAASKVALSTGFPREIEYACLEDSAMGRL